MKKKSSHLVHRLVQGWLNHLRTLVQRVTSFLSVPCQMCGQPPPTYRATWPVFGVRFRGVDAPNVNHRSNQQRSNLERWLKSAWSIPSVAERAFPCPLAGSLPASSRRARECKRLPPPRSSIQRSRLPASPQRRTEKPVISASYLPRFSRIRISTGNALSMRWAVGLPLADVLAGVCRAPASNLAASPGTRFNAQTSQVRLGWRD